MPETYGERVAHGRQEMGLTQPQFAEQIGVPKRTLQDIENGKVGNPQKATREKIDAALDLLGEDETEAEYDSELRAFLNILGVFLWALPAHERTAIINDQIVRLAKRTSS